ncbi:hypothetical protein PAT3040_03556, partial [Paenibacillus agaridevorans]
MHLENWITKVKEDENLLLKHPLAGLKAAVFS